MSTGVHSRPHSRASDGFVSMGVHSRAHKSTTNASQLGSRRRTATSFCVVVRLVSPAAHIWRGTFGWGAQVHPHIPSQPVRVQAPLAELRDRLDWGSLAGLFAPSGPATVDPIEGSGGTGTFGPGCGLDDGRRLAIGRIDHFGRSGCPPQAAHDPKRQPCDGEVGDSPD